MKDMCTCRNCGKILHTEQLIDWKIRGRLTTEYDEIEYDLSDGSRMRVPVCKTCQALTGKDKIKDNKIMDTVKETWIAELDSKYENKMPKEKKDAHIKHYSKLTILKRTKDIVTKKEK